MKNVLTIVCAVCASLLLFSCRSAKVAPLSILNGEWSIVEISGAKIVPAARQNLPFINFDTESGKIFGNSGCNRMMGNFDVNSKKSIINMAGTRMLCPDMTVEKNLLNALARVAGCKEMENGKTALCDKKKRPLVVLKRKIAETNISMLNGEWKIIQVNGKTISSEKENSPFLFFNAGNRTVHGNVGCNSVNGKIVTGDDDAYAISFPVLAATMKACPDMSTEAKVMAALNEIDSFNVSSEGNIVLYDKYGKLSMVLEKK